MRSLYHSRALFSLLLHWFYNTWAWGSYNLITKCDLIFAMLELFASICFVLHFCR